MASESVKLEGGGGKTSTASNTWAWLDEFDKKVDNFSASAERVGESISKVGGVIGSIFGSDSKNTVPEKTIDSGSILLPLAIGGGLALLLR